MNFETNRKELPLNDLSPACSSDLHRATDHWDRWQTTRHTSGQRYADWGDHPTVFKAVMRECFGNENHDFFTYLRAHYPHCQTAHALSLCCGDGSFEAQLIQKGVFERITGLEISHERIKHGQAQIEAGHLSKHMTFLQQDVNLGHFGEACFDVVFAKAALHHIENLELAFLGIKRCLKPGGLLVAIDFFGPTRFQWTQTQLDSCNWFWKHKVLPELQRESEDKSHRPLDEPITRPSIESMLALDPSEAVRSSDLMQLISANFKIQENISLGGTVLNLLLYGDRVNRFDSENPRHNLILEEAVSLERNLMASGTLGSDFKFIVASV